MLAAIRLLVRSYPRIGCLCVSRHLLMVFPLPLLLEVLHSPPSKVKNEAPVPENVK